jgi:hypothetical protein
MKEALERAAEELLNAAARLQELAANIDGGQTLDLKNLSAEDEEKLGQLFNAWTQKNIISDLDEIKDKIGEFESFVDNAPDAYELRELYDDLNYKDFSSLDKLDGIDLDDIEANSESIAQMRQQFEDLAIQLAPLTTLAELLNLDLLIATLQAGIEAKKAQDMSHESAGNGSH